MNIERVSSHESSTAQAYLRYLEEKRGQLSLDECRGLFATVNRFLMPFRDGHCEHEEGTLALIIMLGGNISSKGPMDSLSKFVEEFGSMEAREAYVRNRPQKIRETQPELKPRETPVTVETVRAYLKSLMKHWLGLTSR